MQTYLQGLEVADYDLLLITERFNESLHILNYVIGNMQMETYFGKPPKIPFSNTAADRDVKLSFSEQERSAIYNLIPEDVEIYRRASEILTKKAGLFL